MQYVQTVCYQDMLFMDISTLEDGTHCLSQNTAMEIPFHGAYYPRREQVPNMFNMSVSFHQKNAKWSNIKRIHAWNTVEPRSIVFQGMEKQNDECGKMINLGNYYNCK